MKYFIANWKAHKDLVLARQWVKTFQELLQNSDSAKKKLEMGGISIIICPPFPFIFPMKEMMSDIPNYSLGVQNIASISEGSYTGEVSAVSVHEMARYSIIGHSERRKYFNETEIDIEKKINLAAQYNITPILCIRNEKDTVYADTSILAYEPVEAIGSGKNAGVQDVIDMRYKLGLHQTTAFLYGGSVNSNNCKEYINSKEIDGLLVGTASLDPHEFFAIVSS